MHDGERSLPEAGSLHDLHDDTADLHSQDSLHNLHVHRRVHHSQDSLHHLPHGYGMSYKAGSLHDLHDDTADMHSQSALHGLPSGLRNSYSLTHKMRGSSGSSDNDTLRSSRCVPHGSDLLRSM